MLGLELTTYSSDYSANSFSGSLEASTKDRGSPVIIATCNGVSFKVLIMKRWHWLSHPHCWVLKNG